MDNISLKIAEIFSKFPGPRYRDEGEHSGEEFREEYVEKYFLAALNSNKKLIVDLDGTLGYGTSFLEEVFGGLTRIYNKEVVTKTLEIISNEEPYLKNDIYDYIEKAKK